MSFGTAGSILGKVLTAYGQYKQGQDMATAEEYNADVVRNEGILIAQKGDYEASSVRKQVKSLTGTQQALYSKAGVALSGSAMTVMKDSMAQGEQDALMIEYNATMEAQQKLTEYEYRKKLARDYRKAGIMNAGTTILAGTSAMSFGSTGSGQTQSQIISRDTSQYKNTGTPGQQPSWLSK